MGKKAKTKLKIGCPRCGSHVTRESGFWRCLNPNCRHTVGTQNPTDPTGWAYRRPRNYGFIEEPLNEFTTGFDDPDNYIEWKGKFTKRVGKTEELK